jgi:hypothetical protein
MENKVIYKINPFSSFNLQNLVNYLEKKNSGIKVQALEFNNFDSKNTKNHCLFDSFSH